MQFLPLSKKKLKENLYLAQEMIFVWLLSKENSKEPNQFIWLEVSRTEQRWMMSTNSISKIKLSLGNLLKYRKSRFQNLVHLLQLVWKRIQPSISLEVQEITTLSLMICGISQGQAGIAFQKVLQLMILLTNNQLIIPCTKVGTQLLSTRTDTS
jgi:hypothetical protein